LEYQERQRPEWEELGAYMVVKWIGWFEWQKGWVSEAVWQ